MKTLIVTGAAGFIGCNFTRLALSRGYKVIGLDSLSYAGHRENLEGLGANFELVVEDIRNPKVAELFRAHKPDGVIHFAAESHVDRSIENPLLFVETNVLGTANLLHHALAHWRSGHSGFRFLHVSTDEVFGQLGEEGKFSEQSPLQPSSPYSASKAGSDMLVRAWNHTYGLPTVTTNCSNNYGPFQYPEKLIPVMIQSCLEGKPLPVYGDGRNVRDWIYVEDHCRGVLLAYEKGMDGETYCLGGESERRNIDLVKTLCSVLDKLRPGMRSYHELISFVKDRPGHDWRYAIDCSKAKRELGYRNEFQFESGLEATARWYLENQAWVARVRKK